MYVFVKIRKNKSVYVKKWGVFDGITRTNKLNW